MAADETLIAAVAEGDRRALEELCRRWERPLYQFIHRHTGGRDVEDLHQETWLRVVRAARRFDPRRRFSTWLFQIALNLCRDWHRRPPPDPVDPTDPEPAPRRPWPPPPPPRLPWTPTSPPAGSSPRFPRRSGARSSCATITTSARTRW